ncbi:MAG TPA: YeeE/YedE family protein, partial [Myxococcales bacterium]|nr:YeeE/YedE family protein [Myxococcales bacterium]
MKIASPMKLASGLGTGLAFGFLLQKGRAAKRVEIVDALRFDQWRVAKIMGTASVVGGLGTYALGRAGRVEPKIKPLALGVVTGGALFGAGLAALGYCPGTTVTAAGEG